MKPTAIYVFSEREVHMMGDKKYGVCVAWNMKNQIKTLKDDQGTVYTASVPARSGEPYIDFTAIRNADGDAFEDEDSPVRGGISPEFALKLAVDLQAAVEYLKELQSGG